MTSSRPRGALNALAGLLAGALVADARGQTSPAADRSTFVESDATAAIAPLRSDKPPGEPTRKVAGQPDWAAAREAVRKMRIRDGEYERRIRAITLSRKVTEEEREAMRPRGIRSATVEEFAQFSAGEIARTRVPMLAPMTPDMKGGARAYAREHAYAVVAHLPGGATIEILGTYLRAVGGGASTVKMRQTSRRAAMRELASIGAPYLVSRHEEGVDLSFTIWNVAYFIGVTCPDPKADPRCAKDDFILSLADNLCLLNEQGDAP
jgi:hypothetical protein